VSEIAVKGIPAHRKTEVCRLLAAGIVKRTDIARQFGVTGGAITQFAHRHARLIAEMKQQAASEAGRQIVGLWITAQENRLSAYQADYELSLGNARADHYEHIKARALLLKQAAEELGELQQAMAVVPVQHVVINVDLEALR
jgi:hypothetical protein